MSHHVGCRSAYENLLYCETFHLEESGWRECRLCRKRIHCGCIASKYLYDYLDFGGIGCISCTKSLETRSIRPIQIPNNDISHGFGPFTANNIGDLQSSYVEHRIGGIRLDKEKFTQLSKSMNGNELKEIVFPNGEVHAGFSDLIRRSVGSSIFSIPKNNRPILGEKEMYKSLAQPSTNLIFSNPLETPYFVLPSLGGAVEGSEQNKVPPVKQGKKTRLILPKPPKTGLTVGSDANRGMVSQTRVLRLPDEGRGCNQLLPRYWPRVTDEELQQISGDLNSTVVPLFEKVLSASDASRIGRVVLPKACAEDMKGKEWTFQFRFWPNNKSRMYVLEGINPCIQNMELQAGDIVTFSRIDPGEKLVIAFRKALNFINLQVKHHRHHFGCSSLISGSTSLGLASSSTSSIGRTNEDSLQRPMLLPGKKRARNIGSKNKRLLMHGEDAMELRLTWEEAQELLRPPPSAKPTIVMIEDQEFQEYDDPPVFGKSTIFTSRASGEQEQWAQCDSCSKWRMLPVDVLIPPKWACLDNIWDPSRCSCSAPDEMNPQELESLLSVGNDFKKLRIIESTKVDKEHEPSGLNALANAAVLEDIANDLGEPSAGTTTKHPCDHSGCSCIVCIQLPSGKGKHNSTCTCNACFSLKCPFKTFTSG
ncbi:B3 domain-containing transcription repressor VAL1 [Camellia lanceoleosa]|uniref:B3 domain-containing transcription repressor VAL1 n=1 Tax=Camellia lanceoleosa TaxID=1840588 RepID=A0ACC0F3Z6_9ERIC|nr:B3 domain-containing transcription repressor VAL1 [Camellia lanceoleosa]